MPSASADQRARVVGAAARWLVLALARLLDDPGKGARGSRCAPSARSPSREPVEIDKRADEVQVVDATLVRGDGEAAVVVDAAQYRR